MKIVENDNKMQLNTFLPKKDFVLLTGKIEIMGMELFCGSVAYNKEDGVHFESCSVIQPDFVLYNKLKNKKVGDIVHIERRRIRGGKQIKNDFKLSDVEIDVNDADNYKKALDSFDPNFYQDKDIII